MPQKNSANKKSKKGAGVSNKNTRFIQSILEDLRDDEELSEIHIARVLRKMGNGRVEVFYMEPDKDGIARSFIMQAIIRGSFRGKGKRNAWIEVGSIVAVADVGLAGSAALEIMGVFTPEQVSDLRKEIDIDPRILAVDNVDSAALLSGKTVEEGFVFEADEIDIDDI